MNNRGFLLIDSLITLIVVSTMSILCISIFNAVNNYQEGYLTYKEETNNVLSDIYSSLNKCEVCEIIEDSQALEQ